MYSSGCSMVPLNIPQFKNFAATINLYNHPNNAPSVFPYHIGYTYQTFVTFWVKQTKKNRSFLKISSQTNSRYFKYEYFLGCFAKMDHDFV